MNLLRGVAVCGVLLALAVIGVEAGGASKKTSGLLIGKWKMEKKEKDVTVAITAEFAKDGKMKVAIKFMGVDAKDISTDGTYKLIDDTKLETTVADPGKKEPKKDTWKIETLSKTKLILSREEKGKIEEKLEFDRVK